MDNQMTNEAPTKDEVARAFRHLRHKCSDGSGGYTAINILRAHIAALAAENKRLREALENIANNKFLSYENTEASMYGTGVTDGHRLAAQWARDALAQTGDK